jgi:perosamine synthetase
MNAFETSFVQWVGLSNAFSFWKGRVALYAILKAMGVKDGDEVILPGYTCVMDVNPIKYLGAKPVYVDIEPSTFNMNPALLESKITPKTKIVVAQHTYGYPCDMDVIMAIAAKRGVTVIEDCCLAFGSTYKGKTVGTFGKAAYFSFQWNKPFTTGLGGMALTSDADLAEKIKGLCNSDLYMPSAKEVMMLAAQLAVYRMFIYPRTTALAQNIFRYLTKKGAVVGSSSAAEYNPQMAADFFKGMSSIQARSGLRQLAKIESNVAHRRQMAELYDKLLAEKGWPTRQYDKLVIDPMMVRYPVRIKEKNKAIQQAASAGIELGTWFECPLHPIETPMEAYDYKIGMCPEAEKASKETVNLPLHPRVSEKTIRRTVEFISQFHPA